MTTAVKPRHRPRAGALPHCCDNHTDYTAGCTACQAAGRVRFNTIYRAKVYGIHQPALVPAIGAARRLQGLAAEGHEARDIAKRLGVNCTLIVRWRAPAITEITRRRHNDIAALTEQLAATPGTSRLARTTANRYGWVPIAAWDDIDDPNDTPHIRSTRARDIDALINRVHAGHGSIDLLTDQEQQTLWRLWSGDPQRTYRDGVRTFARQFDISAWRASRIAAAAHTAADGRTNERTAA